MKPIRHTATLLTLAFLAGLALLTPPRAHAQINYQGRLTDAAGATLADGQYTITFSLWDLATGGTQLWGPYIADGGVATGHGPLVDVVGGINPNGGRFNVIIGGTDTASRSLTTALAAFALPFLEIKVGTNAAISPRQQILATPRALRADVIPNVTPVGNNVGIGTTNPATRLHIVGGSDTSLVNGHGYLVLGDEAGSNVSFDNNEIQARNNGAASGLILNAEGGNVTMLAAGTGNVGIGGGVPGAKLDVRGDIKLGSTGQYYAPAAEENLRIVRGTVNADGTIVAGAGFTVTKGATGFYTINFTVPFSSTPTVTLTITDAAPFYDELKQTVTSSSFVANFYFPGNGYVDLKFGFIAIGPR